MWHDRFERLWLFVVFMAALVPREFNIRLKYLSFSVTDIFFLFAILTGLVLLLGNRDKNILKPDQITVMFVIIPLAIIITAAFLDISIKGANNRHIFLRDIYSFSILPITFFIARSFKIEHSKLIEVLFIASLMLALWTFIIIYMPPVSAWYVEMGKATELSGGDVGYAMPSMGHTGPVFANGQVRPAILMGGSGHLGWFTLLTVPLFFEYFKVLKARFGSVLTALSIMLIFLSFLHLMSRSAIIGLSFALILWLYFSITAARTKLICAGGILAAVLLFSISGNLAFLGKKFSEIRSVSTAARKFSESRSVSTAARWPTSTDVRIKMYSKALRLIKSDFVLGIGMGNTFKETIYKDDKFEWSDKFDSVDSFYLTILLKLGVIGYFLFFMFFYFLYRAYLYMRQKNRGSPDLIVSAFSGFSGILIGGAFAYFLHSPSFNIILATVMGIALKGLFVNERFDVLEHKVLK